MTDGIIQQVFNEIFRKHNESIATQRGYDIFTTEDLIKIQQELIEKIKQECEEYYYEGYPTGKLIILDKLIGDNKQ